MIPRKLYIPTSTLNFNNIMSSESISPAAFYASRGFGYKRFEKVEPNNLNNRIVLYSKFPVFNIQDKEMENYPLVIEVDSQSINNEIIQELNGFFYADKTIYLNPFTSKFIFRNELEMIRTKFKAEPSIEAKMVALYENCLIVKTNEIDEVQWSNNAIRDSKTDYSNYISDDRKINKLKGLLYAYLLAANKSLSTEIVSLKMYVKLLRNILSAIVSSPNGRATYQQTEQLEKLYKEINEYLYKADGIYIKIEEIAKQKSVEYNCPNFLDIIKKENLYPDWFAKQIREQGIKQPFQIQPFLLFGNAKTSEEKNVFFTSYMDQLDRQIRLFELQQCKSKLEVFMIPIVQHYKILRIPKQMDFLTKLFNEYLEEAYTSMDFIQSRYEFAKAGGKLFRGELLDKWDDSPTRTYINALLKNLNEYTSFSINSIDNITLKSFAAFCQKGESDIDKLEDYLISNGIGDFKIAFALWGSIFGFAEMPKTLTNDLFQSDDVDYVSNIYKYIFKQLHGIDLEGTLQCHPVVKPMGAKQPEHSQSATYSSKINRKTNTLPFQQSHSDAKPIPDELKLIFDSEEFNLMKPEAKKYYKVKVLEYYKGSINNDFIKSIEKLEFSKTKITWRACIKLVKPPKEKKQKNNKKNGILDTTSRTLFGAIKPSDKFYKDTSAFELLFSSLPNDKKIQKQFKEDVEWFQGNYNKEYIDKKKGPQKGFYSDLPTDNASVIEKFNNYLKNKQTSGSTNMEWLRAMYSKVDVEIVIQKLKELYLNEQ